MTIYHHALSEFEQALDARKPLHALRQAARVELERGSSGDELLGELNELRLHLRQEGRTDAEDAVMEVMDALLGWTSPHLVL